MKTLFSICAALVLLMPSVLFADGLVPCGDPGQPMCETCHLYQLTENVFNWLFGIISTLVTIIIVVSGLRMVSSRGNAIAMRSARKWVSTAIVGFVLVGSAWGIIRFLIIVLSGSADSVDIFSSIQCTGSS